MGQSTIQNLVETRNQVLLQVNQGALSVSTAASILGITRQGLWKVRRRVAANGISAALGRKRGPKSYYRVWNRKPVWLEDEVERIFDTTGGVGADRILWFLDDGLVTISRSTVYRILVRRRLLIPKERKKREPVTLYAKGYPGEEVQMDTTEPLGKSGPTLISAIDDCSRYGFADCYQGNRSYQAGAFLERIISEAPFPIQAVRVDNGSEFKGAFVRTCKKLRVRLIRNPVRHPTSNGKVERFHRVIEEECFWRMGATPDNLELARYWLSRYLSWYNTKRKHGGYGMLGRTPKERIEDWILDHHISSPLYWRDVNETLILYIPRPYQKIVVE